MLLFGNLETAIRRGGLSQAAATAASYFQAPTRSSKRISKSKAPPRLHRDRDARAKVRFSAPAIPRLGLNSYDSRIFAPNGDGSIAADQLTPIKDDN